MVWTRGSPCAHRDRRGSRGEGSRARRFPQRGNRLFFVLALLHEAWRIHARSSSDVPRTLPPRAPQSRTGSPTCFLLPFANPVMDRPVRFAGSHPRSRGPHPAHWPSRPRDAPTRCGSLVSAISNSDGLIAGREGSRLGYIPAGGEIAHKRTSGGGVPAD